VTADELRAAEDFLDRAAAFGVTTLDGARRLLSAVILGVAIHESHAATVDEAEEFCSKFLIEGR